MPKILIRIVALILVPCFIADPATSSTSQITKDIVLLATSQVHYRFNQEAFAELGLNYSALHRYQLRVPLISRLLGKYKPTWNSGNLWWENAALTGAGIAAIVASAPFLWFLSLGVFVSLHLPNVEQHWKQVMIKAALFGRAPPHRFIWASSYILSLLGGSALLQLTSAAPFFALKAHSPIWVIASLTIIALAAHLSHAPYSQWVQKHLTFRVGGMTLGLAPLTIQQSEGRYILNREENEVRLRTKHERDRLIAPGYEDFETFRNLYQEVDIIFKRLLTAQGLNPGRFSLYLVDTMEPEASVMRHYPVAFLSLGLLRLFTERGMSRDALAACLAHQVILIQQMREDVDLGRADQPKNDAEDRIGGWEADIRALTLIDRAGFTVKEAPLVYAALLHWIETRKIKRSPWGAAADLEERLRRIERHILEHHWVTYLADPTPMSEQSRAEAEKRTRRRMFQDKVMQVHSGVELFTLIEEAKAPEEAQFALLIGYLGLSEKARPPVEELKRTFETKIAEYSPSGSANRLVLDFVNDSSYFLLMNSRRVNAAYQKWMASLENNYFNRINHDTVNAIIELGTPPIFLMTINVDQLAENDRHRQAQDVLSLINVRDGFGFHHYGVLTDYQGLLQKMAGRMHDRMRNGEISLVEARRLFHAVSRIHEESHLLSLPHFVENMLESPSYAGEMTVADVQSLLQILGSDNRMDYQGHANAIYNFAQRANPLVREAVLEWLMNGIDPYQRRKEVVDIDIENFLKTGQGLLASGNAAEYIGALLRFEFMLKDYSLNRFLDLMSPKMSAAELVDCHQKVLGTFRAKHLGDYDAGIFDFMVKRMREDPQLFAGDVFEEALLKAVDPSLRDRVRVARRELKPLLYVYALGGIVPSQEMREFVFGQPDCFGAWTVTPEGKKVYAFDKDLVIRIVQTQTLYPSLYEPKDFLTKVSNAPSIPRDWGRYISSHYRGLPAAEQDAVRNMWNAKHPDQPVRPNVRKEEFQLLVEFLESIRPDLGRRLAKEGASPEVADQAFAAYAIPVSLQRLFQRVASPVRFIAPDVRTSQGDPRSQWASFDGEIVVGDAHSMFNNIRVASTRRPRRITRVNEASIPAFLSLFDWLERLPVSFQESTEIIVHALPPCAYRNYSLYLLFVDRVLIRQMGMRIALGTRFDLNAMHKQLAKQKPDKRAQIMKDARSVMPYLVNDSRLEDGNNATVVAYIAARIRGKRNRDPQMVRAGHAAELAAYEDALFATPGGPLTQISIFMGRFAEQEMTSLCASQAPLRTKMEGILAYFPQASTARDRWLKMALESNQLEGTPNDIHALLSLFANRSLRETMALRALDKFRASHPEDFEQLDRALIVIQRLFPDNSPLRDDILQDTAQDLADTPQAYAKIETRLTDPFQKPEQLREKEESRIAFGQAIFHALIQAMDPKEKVELLLWLIGAKDEKPFRIIDLEFNFHIQFDHFRELFMAQPSRYYQSAGLTFQREFLEPFLYGEKSIFNDAIANQQFLEGLFNAMVPAASNRTVMKVVYDAIFLHAAAVRREELILALTHMIGRQHVERQFDSSELDPLTQETKVFCAFLEANKLIGVKVGQVIFRSRPEINLHERARPFPKGLVFDLIAKLYGRFEDKFQSVGPNKSASIKVVYDATLSDGRKKKLKAKRPEIDKRIEEDLAFLRKVIETARPGLEAAGVAIPRQLVTQVERILREEVDFDHEELNSRRLRENLVRRTTEESAAKGMFGQTLAQIIPPPQHIYEILVPQVMEVVMNMLMIEDVAEGVSLSDESGLEAVGADVADVKRAVAWELLQELFLEGFYHADPKGNVLATAERISMIDLGAASSINFSNRLWLGQMLQAVSLGNKEALYSLVQSLGGIVTPMFDQRLSIKVLDGSQTLVTRALWFFQLMEDFNMSIPEELLATFRFLGAAGSLFESARLLDKGA